MTENWDEKYRADDRIWSGRPNASLIAETASLTPGSVLDVGCGEGADAVWLAGQGWQVVALDVSSVALERARQAAATAGVTIEWIHAGLVEAHLAPGSFDLVSAQYPALPKSDEHSAERALTSAVRPGGLLLFVHHADFGAGDGSPDHGHDFGDYVGPRDIAAFLDADWTIELHEQRARQVTEGAGRHHTHDVVIRARRNA